MIARLILLSGTALASLAAPAHAQEIAPDQQALALLPEAAAVDTVPATSAGGGGGEIVVTARRRAETLQDVPIAVSVVGGEQLASTGSYNVGRLTQLQPSLQFYSTNPRNTSLNIRGLGAPYGLTNDGIEQGVGVYVDQVYYARVAASTFDFPDVDRIEVLRGPQGTLYGKNTTAGAINIVTRRPSFEWEGRAEISYGSYDFIQARASISGPLVGDSLALRLSGSYTHRDGTITNVVTGHDQNELDNRTIRGQLLWRPADNLNVLLSADYNFQSPECCVQIYVREGATQRPLNRQYAALAAAFGYQVPSTNPFDRLTDVDTPLTAEQEIGGASALVEWEVGPGTLTSVSAWRFWTWEPSNDRDFLGLRITTQSANPSQQDQFSQELRYAGTIGPVDFVLGAFYFQQRIDTQGLQVQGPDASRFLLNPGNVPPGSTGCATPTANACNPAVLDGLTSTNTIGYDNNSAALFGQLTWRLSDRLRIAPGIRINRDEKYGRYDAVVTTGSGSTNLNNDQRGVLSPQSFEVDFSDWNVAYDFTLSYDVAPDILFYATYAHTFKSGGVNQTSLPTDASNNPILSAATVAPENVDHFEAGLKTRFLDRRVTFNLTAYWTDVHDFQTQVFNGQLGVLRGYLANADHVRVRGVEAELSARVTDRLSFYVNGAFTDGRYVRFPDAPCPPELSGGTTVGAGQTPSAPGMPGGLSPANCDISGQWLPGVSRWAATYGLDYVAPTNLFGRAGEIYFGFDGSFRSKFSGNPSRSAYTDVEGYALANFRAGVRDTEGRWDLSAWVRNAFQEEYFELLAVQSGNTGLIVGQPGDPRTAGVTFRTRF